MKLKFCLICFCKCLLFSCGFESLLARLRMIRRILCSSGRLIWPRWLRFVWLLMLLALEDGGIVIRLARRHCRLGGIIHLFVSLFFWFVFHFMFFCLRVVLLCYLLSFIEILEIFLYLLLFSLVYLNFFAYLISFWIFLFENF